jgi:MFS family permease
MKPYTRELIPDRRQPALKWGAVLAGATIAVAFWVLLQMLGMGAGLAAVDVDNAGSLRTIGIGTTVWTMLAPLVALFIGGFVAGRLATTFDQKNGAMHGFVVGSLASLAGLIATVAVVSMIANASMRGTASHMIENDDISVAPSLRAEERSEAAKNAGKILLGAGISLLLGIGAAVAGGGIASRRFTRRNRTQEVPVVPPPEPPAPKSDVIAD